MVKGDATIADAIIISCVSADCRERTKGEMGLSEVAMANRAKGSTRANRAPGSIKEGMANSRAKGSTGLVPLEDRDQVKDLTKEVVISKTRMVCQTMEDMVGQPFMKPHWRIMVAGSRRLLP